jgi:hypothetical protein
MISIFHGLYDNIIAPQKKEEELQQFNFAKASPLILTTSLLKHITHVGKHCSSATTIQAK